MISYCIVCAYLGTHVILDGRPEMPLAGAKDRKKARYAERAHLILLQALLQPNRLTREVDVVEGSLNRHTQHSPDQWQATWLKAFGNAVPRTSAMSSKSLPPLRHTHS